MFKFIHAADIHIDSPMRKLDLYEGVPRELFRGVTRRAFENLIDIALTEKVDFVIIAGDLYDGDWKDYNTGLYLVSKLNRLRDAGIGVFIVAGNHDASNKITKTLRFPDNVVLFPSDKPMTVHLNKIDVAIHGQSFATAAVKKDLSERYPESVSGVFNIGILHTSLNGRKGHEPYAPCSLKDLHLKGYDYWALGHVHHYEMVSTDPIVVFPGNTQGRHIRECGEKGCVLVTVNEQGESSLEFKTVDVVRWELIDLDISDIENAFEVVDRFYHELILRYKKNEEMPLAVRALFKGKTPACDEILSDVERWINEIRSAGLDVGDGNVWIEKVRFDLEMAVKDQLKDFREGAIGEMLEMFNELSENDVLKAMFVEELSALLKRLPKEFKQDRETYSLDEIEWIDQLLVQVKPMLMKRLLGKKIDED